MIGLLNELLVISDGFKAVACFTWCMEDSPKDGGSWCKGFQTL